MHYVSKKYNMTGGETQMNDSKEKQRFMSVDELAEMLGVKPSWVYGQTSAGSIPHLKVGRYVRFRAEDVLAWLAQKS